MDNSGSSIMIEFWLTRRVSIRILRTCFSPDEREASEIGDFVSVSTSIEFSVKDIV
jgi:hypothetical protein